MFNNICMQIKKQQLSDNSFWVKANEEQFESLELFQDIEKTFGTGKVRGVEVSAGPKLKLPKIKELKVLDAKSAQNICKIISFFHVFNFLLFSLAAW